MVSKLKDMAEQLTENRYVTCAMKRKDRKKIGEFFIFAYNPDEFTRKVPFFSDSINYSLFRSITLLDYKRKLNEFGRYYRYNISDNFKPDDDTIYISRTPKSRKHRNVVTSTSGESVIDLLETAETPAPTETETPAPAPAPAKKNTTTATALTLRRSTRLRGEKIEGGGRTRSRQRSRRRHHHTSLAAAWKHKRHAFFA